MVTSLTTKCLLKVCVIMFGTNAALLVNHSVFQDNITVILKPSTSDTVSKGSFQAIHECLSRKTKK